MIDYISKLDKKWYKYTIPHIIRYIVVIKGIFYLLIVTELLDSETLFFIPEKFLQGELWRLFTFFFIPKFVNPVFAFINLYLLYFMGTALENILGSLRFNIFLATSVTITLLLTFIHPEGSYSSYYIFESVYLIFALTFPDFPIRFNFLFTVRVKWLSLLVWFHCFINLIKGSFSVRLMIAAALVNLLIFYGKRIIRLLTRRKTIKKASAALKTESKKPFHTCSVCGASDVTHPWLNFRYNGKNCYCEDHISIKNH